MNTGPYRFEHERVDTESLNRRALAGDLDVVAISIATYPAVAKDYLLLPHGGSVGTRVRAGGGRARPRAARVVRWSIDCGAWSRNHRIPRPALAALRVPAGVLAHPALRPVFAALRDNEVDAALLIHEGRLTYEREGLRASPSWEKRGAS